ncbi:MAG: aminopeptidase P family protein [Myxococcales bacterium]|nr:aminopeptidase P family protein [Myxococcales bacterium]
MRLEDIQKALQSAQLDGWLFYDFHNRDPIAYRVLGLDYGKFTSRRWFYFIPARGEPVKLAHKVEPGKLDSLPGTKRLYLSWRELHQNLAEILKGTRRLAMQISPLAAIPYVSTVDAGTAELVRGFGVELCSSAELVQAFEAVIDEAGYRSHREAGEKIHRIKDQAFARIGEALKKGQKLTEVELQRFILRRFKEEGLTCMGENPIVGINDHPADPHFEPTEQNSRPFARGDKVLIDLWAKLERPGAIFYDITWCGFIGKSPPARYQQIFRLACQARRAAVALVRERFRDKKSCCGWEVDDACRKVIQDGGFGEFFIHRTGHSIGEAVHGNGVNIDNLETRDERRLVPGVCFSIEPGIYLPGEMAVRTEIDVFITAAGEVEVTGPEQEELILIEA